MAQKIYLKSNKTFRGPFTDGPDLLSGETSTPITDTQYNQLVSLKAAGNPQNRFILYDSETFRFGTLDECSVASPNLRWGLIFLFRKLALQIDRAKLYPLYVTLGGLFDDFGENLEKNTNVRADVKVMIANALEDETEAAVTAIQQQMLDLPQWTY